MEKWVYGDWPVSRFGVDVPTASYDGNPVGNVQSTFAIRLFTPIHTINQAPFTISLTISSPPRFLQTPSPGRRKRAPLWRQAHSLLLWRQRWKSMRWDPKIRRKTPWREERHRHRSAIWVRWEWWERHAAAKGSF